MVRHKETDALRCSGTRAIAQERVLRVSLSAPAGTAFWHSHGGSSLSERLRWADMGSRNAIATMGLSARRHLCSRFAVDFRQRLLNGHHLP